MSLPHTQKPRVFVRMIALSLMNKEEQWLLEEKYAGEKTPAYGNDLKRLFAGEPLAYVIGHIPFLGLKIYLDSKPLIPRPETEWWTERLLHTYAQQDLHFSERPEPDEARQSKFSTENYAVPRSAGPAPLRFLDLCAGSGAIGCAALAQLPNAQVYFGEVDLAHKTTILKNIRENKLDESRATVNIGDLFAPFADTRFNVIATNPPYIPKDRVLEKSVTDYEPSVALFSGSDGLDLIRRIAKKLPDHLSPQGVAWIECDSARAAAACALFDEQGFKTHVINDQYGAPRVVVVSFPQ